MPNLSETTKFVCKTTKNAIHGFGEITNKLNNQTNKAINQVQTTATKLVDNIENFAEENLQKKEEVTLTSLQTQITKLQDTLDSLQLCQKKD